MIISTAISSGNVDKALQNMQSTTQLISAVTSSKNVTNSTSQSTEVKKIQQNFLTILSNISQTTTNATQDSALIQLQTLSSVVSLGSTDSVTTVAVDVASTLTSKISLKEGEVLDSTISSSVVTVLDTALASTFFSLFISVTISGLTASTPDSSNSSISQEEKVEKSKKVMETLSNLFQLQVKNRVCGETPIGTESEVNMKQE